MFLLNSPARTEILARNCAIFAHRLKSMGIDVAELTPVTEIPKAFLTELALCTRAGSAVGLLCFQIVALMLLLRSGDSFAIGIAVVALAAARLQVDAVSLMRGKELLSHSEVEWEKIVKFAAAMQLIQVPLGLAIIVKILSL
jgi:hypothetical protein